MNTLQKVCLTFCVLMMCQQYAASFPTMGDSVGLSLDDGLERSDLLVDKRRRMGWSLCSRYFKWRCGKTQKVVRG